MRHAEQKTFETHDKVALFYRYWPAQSATPRGAVVLFHRGHEHSGRMAHLADELDLPDFAVFAWDARGHGRSRAALASEASGQRGTSLEVRAPDTRPEPGSPARASERGFSPSLGTSVRDVDTFVHHVAATYGVAVENMAVIAQSVGAVLISVW